MGLRIRCIPAEQPELQWNTFTVHPQGTIVVRSKKPGDTMRLNGGTKSLKALFIDRKIPASQRLRIPVAADEKGVLGVYGIGPNLDRLCDHATELRFEALQDE